MKTITKLLFLAVMLFFFIFTGCVSKKVTRSTEVSDSVSVEKDSVRIEYRYTEKVDTFRIAADSSWLTALVECTEDGRVLLKEIVDIKVGIRSMPRLKIKDSLIYIDCGCDSAEFYAVQKELRELKFSLSEDAVTVSKESTWYKKIVKVKIPFWLWFGGGIVLLFFLLKAVMKFVIPLLKIAAKFMI